MRSEKSARDAFPGERLKMLKIKYENPDRLLYEDEFTMYTVLTDYFKSSECVTPVIEKHLQLYYMEMTDRRVEEVERDCEWKAAICICNFKNLEKKIWQ